MWHTRLEPETKEPFCWGSKLNKGIPYFHAIYPKLGVLKRLSGGYCGQIIAVLSSNDVS